MSKRIVRRHKRRPPKAQCQRLHAIKRGIQRHGIQYTSDDLSAFATQITRGAGVHVRKETNRISIWDVWCDKKNGWLRVAYDRTRHSIASIYPEIESTQRANDNEASYIECHLARPT